MHAAARQSSKLVVAIVTGCMAVAPAHAAKPDSPGQGKGKGGPPSGSVEEILQPESKHAGQSLGGYGLNTNFSDSDRDIIRRYFGQEFKRGNCPPGLAKKRNGCMPPGLAKKWRLGHPLPDDLIYHDLPGALLRELGRTEEGYKLVRVGVDVLKIAIGTGMVVDAIEDLSSL